MLAVSSFEDGTDWRIAVLTDGPPDSDALLGFEDHLNDDDAYEPPAPVDEVDWVVKVQEDMPPIRAGRFWVSGSHVAISPPAGTIALRVDGTAAFGTGHHGSTRGCLLALDRLARRAAPVRILDIGTGTGILAVAAAKLWHRPVLASDNDPVAVKIARSVARDNEVSPLVRCVHAEGMTGRDIVARRPYDLIVANIVARPLIALAQQITQHAAPRSNIILSGILDRQARPVLTAYRHAGFVPDNVLALGEWVTLTLRRR